jgi:DNA-binding response OmpR family regulator
MVSRPHIVIVDDEIRFRETIGRILERKGFVATLVESGGQALELLETVDPDVVLLDIRMPGLAGDAALPRILAMKPRSRVIILTGHGDEASAHKAFENGAFDYLCKPCDIEVLVGRIDDALKARRPGRERERTVTDVMIPIERYTCVQASWTVRQGIEELRKSSENFISTGLVMESGHKSVLVFDGEELVGVLNMRNLIRALAPVHLLTEDGALLPCAKYSPMFWSGFFSARVPELESKTVRDIMNPRSPVVNCDANLMQVAYLLYEENRRRVVVEKDGRVIGVVREQELFQELSRLILNRGRVS